MDRSGVWEILRTGGTVGRDTPGHEDYDRALNECIVKRLRYNTLPLTPEERKAALSDLLGYPVSENTKVVPPFHCDLGFNIKLGKNVLINYDCILLDTAEISVGDNTLIGPGTKIVTANHPHDAEKRRDWSVSGNPIKIEEDVWMGAGVVVIPGVTIGARSIIGAGSVVTKDVSPDTVVAGNPARIIRYL
ncbi:2,3,4,5-tetrahydropyridine-2,6-dicarboxylate N-acetyltransferase [Candidatus Methanoplasma termitum]|uniref:DapH2 protein n=1 Tax=Candidatus Methanoplasma termitum TaxID=1577791 RepID=A0A0A7LHF7_9ARCH|nr:sugar O-acetyltransferase [Candidatus Methanoplasma termitum]AIZ56951.1 2,3,4,5-tetrahydropyridine-2,6-dicarboxylate N-acetyltransferase [Candidatus Methanoplasma termitum]MCL2333265.1 sugar O-acetyltransferase [Candidatus Methanoplasma sp.]